MNKNTFTNRTYIVKGETEAEIIPHDCPVCNLCLRDLNDTLSYEKFECCTDCRDFFVYLDLDAWKMGKRPTQEQIDDFRKNLRERPSYLLI